MTQKDILRFWRDIEIFNLPDFPKDLKLLQEDKLLPWNAKPLPKFPNSTWRYTLLFGRIKKIDVIQSIDAVLEQPPKEPIEPVTGFTCLAALVLDEDGRPDAKSYIQSSYLHGINCLTEKKSIEEVSRRLMKAQEDYELRYAIPKEGAVEAEEFGRKGLSITNELLISEKEHLQKVSNTWMKDAIEIFFLAKEVPKDSDPDTSFLNSFYIEDLSNLINSNLDFGLPLEKYLSIDLNFNDRKDLITDRKEFLNCLDPVNISEGRWPSKLEFGLYAAQSAAINTIGKNLNKKGGMIGINGPPGTGKTTLLKDIIADIIVQRAKRLLLPENKRLFTSYKKIENERGYKFFNYVNNHVFGDSGIVVASNNNGAVENITKELPASKDLEEALISQGYFSEIAQKLIKAKAWGILSAALGNGSNRSAFKNGFWNTDRENKHKGFSEYLKQAADQTGWLEKLEESKTKLKSLLVEFEIFRNDVSKFHHSLYSHLEDLTQHLRLEAEIKEITCHLAGQKHKIENLKKENADLLNSIQQLKESIKLNDALKPLFFFIQKLLNTSAYQKWFSKVCTYLTELDKKMLMKSDFENNIKRSEKYLADLEAQWTEIHTRLNMVKDNLEDYDHQREKLKTAYGLENSGLIGEDYFSISFDTLHLSTPYSSRKINRLRSEIFMSSLEVHKYTILANAKKFRSNLELFFDVLAGKEKLPNDIVLQLWDTFFFCVPVVSTSLASASKLFSSFGKESIGWLLLDEAGQATPQSAAGIIGRAKRCVIVGDPLQIEPVITIPESLVRKLRQQHNIDITWSPLATSVQKLADRISILGSYMVEGAKEEPIWTGFPLRTHRRCNDPMFSVSNQIAYDGQMVKAQKDSDFNLAPSCWFHVAGSSVYNKQVMAEELEELLSEVNKLRLQNYQGQVYVISPFKSIAQECGRTLAFDKGVLCGTVHTFQGKEADVVFLVLGTDLKSIGARNWASSKPNLLNVAVTRAKKRLYVIGNRNLWAKQEYFDVLAKGLETVESNLW